MADHLGLGELGPSDRQTPSEAGRYRLEHRGRGVGRRGSELPDRRLVVARLSERHVDLAGAAATRAAFTYFWIALSSVASLTPVRISGSPEVAPGRGSEIE